MKTTVNPVLIPFPKLMINANSGLIALMISPNCGTIIVKGNSSMNIGDYSDKLTSGLYTDFEGEVILSNK